MRKQTNWGFSGMPDIRLNKHIADSGVCARRKADELIAQGHVQVNGQTVTEMGHRINSDCDVVTIDGRPLPVTEKVYLAFHKPVGVVTSRKAGRQQKSIYALLPRHYQSVDPAGRLDQDSSGLLILSNDGDFLHRITHPRFHLPKVYEITLNQVLKPADIQKLLDGIRLLPEDKLARMTAVKPITRHPPTYQVTLITGYNRQIRRSLEALGFRIQTLQRLSFGPIPLGNSEPGEMRPLSSAEINQLLASVPATEPEQGQNRTQDKNRKVKKDAQAKRQDQTRRQSEQKKANPGKRPGSTPPQ